MKKGKKKSMIKLKPDEDICKELLQELIEKQENLLTRFSKLLVGTKQSNILLKAHKELKLENIHQLNKN